MRLLEIARQSLQPRGQRRRRARQEQGAWPVVITELPLDDGSSDRVWRIVAGTDQQEADQ